MNRKLEFMRLYRLLDLSAAEVGELIDRTPGTVRQYASAGKSARVPTDAVIDAMRVAWKECATERLEKTVSDLRDLGFIIDWAAVEHDQHDGDVAFRKPTFAKDRVS